MPSIFDNIEGKNAEKKPKYIKINKFFQYLSTALLRLKET